MLFSGIIIQFDIELQRLVGENDQQNKKYDLSGFHCMFFMVGKDRALYYLGI